MDFGTIDIGIDTISFLKRENYASVEAANAVLREVTGVVDFFEREGDFVRLWQTLNTGRNIVSDNRAEYGDFQTNRRLSKAVCSHLLDKNINPRILLEPTCGKGSFILSAIESFDTLQEVYGIEIQEKYLWQLKFALLEYFLNNPAANKPSIYLYHCNVFDFDFNRIKTRINGRELLIIGNPPWVTNSMLSTLNSNNLPAKSNFKHAKGIDAITGKGNFDIAEFISIQMLDKFSSESGYFAFLLKNSVIKNIVFDQKKNKYPISGIEKRTIDAMKEFGASVDAGLLFCRLNSSPEFTAEESDFYTSIIISTLGWVNDRFASDTEKYKKYRQFDGVCPFEWRQGIKHDCAKIMELERTDSGFRNALGEEVELEEDLIYGLLKSSDLKGERVNTSRKYTIVTQKKPGQETNVILEKLPKTKAYLQRHKDYFLNRKSSIYNGKPAFSIFGIGDYSFKPYKVAISGLYKQTLFTLVEPGSTVLMLDDTCYFIGFDTLEDATMVQSLLNRPETQEFIQSFVFTDAKRVITKDILMRIDLNSIVRGSNCSQRPCFEHASGLKNQPSLFGLPL